MASAKKTPLPFRKEKVKIKKAVRGYKVNDEIVVHPNTAKVFKDKGYI